MGCVPDIGLDVQLLIDGLWLFADALKKHSTLEILQLIERYEAEDPELLDAGARNGDRTGHIIQVSKVPLNTSVPKFFLLSLRRVSETVNSR